MYLSHWILKILSLLWLLFSVHPDYQCDLAKPQLSLSTAGAEAYIRTCSLSSSYVNTRLGV